MATLITILEKLGGPNIKAEDVEWVADLPVGRDLLEFLSSQTTDEVALKEIGLETEEADLWYRAVHAKLVTEDPPCFTPVASTELAQTPLDYVPPSVLRSQLGDIEEEQALLDRELRALNKRIALERSAINAEKRSQKAVAAAHNRISSSISHLQEQLSELSMQADSTVATAVQAASRLVNEFSGTGGEDFHHAYQHTTELSKLLEAFSDISSDLARLSSAQFQINPNDPLADSDSLRDEAQRLASSIRVLEDKHVDIALEEECEKLENGENSDKILSMAKNQNERDVPKSGWIEAAIEQAWRREQAIELRRRIQVLEQIADLLQDKLLPPLALIHSSLSISEASIDEAQVKVQVLVDELDDIEADLDLSENAPAAVQQSQDTFEERAKALLKRLRHLRPLDIPSLVLTDHEDLLSELSDVRARYDRANDEITELCSAISADLLSLNAPAQQYLAALTAHSPMPTAPPLALPPRVQHQTSRARAHIDAALATMPVDLAMDSRARRKFDAFVDTHGRAPR